MNRQEQELVQKWRDAIVQLKKGIAGSHSYDLKRMINERCEAFTICADELAALSVASAPPRDIKRMVERFLQWRLPKDFNPDCGISFNKTSNNEPVGTNLFDYTQAEQMVRFMVEQEGVSSAPPENLPCHPWQIDTLFIAYLTPSEYKRVEHAKIEYSGATGAGNEDGSKDGYSLGAYIASYFHELPKALHALGWHRPHLERKLGQWILWAQVSSAPVAPSEELFYCARCNARRYRDADGYCEVCAPYGRERAAALASERAPQEVAPHECPTGDHDDCTPMIIVGAAATNIEGDAK